MTGQSSDEKFRLTNEACQKIYIHDLLEILVGHVFCCKCHLSPEWRVGRLSAGCRWMRCFLAGQSCSADRGQRIYTHITAHNSPIRKNTRFTWKIPTLRGSPSLSFLCFMWNPLKRRAFVLVFLLKPPRKNLAPFSKKFGLHPGCHLCKTEPMRKHTSFLFENTRLKLGITIS